MSRSKTRGQVIRALASVAVAGAAALAATTPASAATVPNRYYCHPVEQWCYQINGAYVPGVARECHRKHSGMAGKPHQISASLCNRWGNPIDIP